MNIKNINYIKFAPILNTNKIIINKFCDINVKKLSTPRSWSQKESLRVLDLWGDI